MVGFKDNNNTNTLLHTHTYSMSRANMIQTQNIEEVYQEKNASGKHMRLMEEAAIRHELGEKATRLTGDEFDVESFGVTGLSVLSRSKSNLFFELDKKDRIELSLDYLIKKSTGEGANTLKGKRRLTGRLFTNQKPTSMLPRNELSSDLKFGMSDSAMADYKSGSILPAIAEWANPTATHDLKEVNGHSIVSRTARGEDYRHMMIKGMLYLMQINSGYTCGSTDAKVAPGGTGIETMTRNCDLLFRLLHLGRLVINTDVLGDNELWVAQLCCEKYPQMIVKQDGKRSIYGNILMEKEDVSFIKFTEDKRRVRRQVMTPERWWKTLVRLACNLGALKDLLYAARYVLGLGTWFDLLARCPGSDQEPRTFLLDMPRSRGFSSCLEGSTLRRIDYISKPSNLWAVSGALIADVIFGQEMHNTMLYIIDRFGASNPKIFGSKAANSSICQSLMIERGYELSGVDNKWRLELIERTRRESVPWSYRYLIGILREVSTCIMRVNNGLYQARDLNFCSGTSPYLLVSGKLDSSVAVNQKVAINSRSWGMVRDAEVSWDLRNWMCVHGLLDQSWSLRGLGLVGNRGAARLTQRDMDSLLLASGVYELQFCEVNVSSQYVARSGSETLETNVIGLVRTYLGVELGGRKEWKKKIEPQLVPEEPKSTKTTVQRPPPREEFVPIVDLPEMVTVGGGRPKPGGGLEKGLGELEHSKGIEGYFRAQGSEVKMVDYGEDIEGNGGVAAVVNGLQALGVQGTDPLIDYITSSAGNDKDWFDAALIAEALEQAKMGLILADDYNGVVGAVGYGTAGLTPNAILGVYWHNGHYYTLDQAGDKTLHGELKLGGDHRSDALVVHQAEAKTS
jgi:hypothetical protein